MRRAPASVNPVMVSTASTRWSGTPLVAASARRCVRPVRPGCTAVGVQQRAQRRHRRCRTGERRSVHERCAGGGPVQPHDHPHRRRLAGAVGTEQPGYCAGPHRETDIVYGNARTEVPRRPRYLYRPEPLLDHTQPTGGQFFGAEANTMVHLRRALHGRWGSGCAAGPQVGPSTAASERRARASHRRRAATSQSRVRGCHFRVRAGGGPQRLARPPLAGGLTLTPTSTLHARFARCRTGGRRRDQYDIDPGVDRRGAGRRRYSSQ